VSRRRKLASIYARIFRTYWTRGASLLTLGVVVFVPLGLVEALAAEVNLDALDPSEGFKVAAAVAAISAVTMTSLLGEVFYSGAVAISLTLSEDETPPSLRQIAGRLNYRRLIAVDLIYVVMVILGTIALFVPGALIFVFFGLSGPIVELEDRTVRGALARSFRLVRGHFWVVFFVLVPIEIVGDSLAEGIEGLVHGTLGHSIFAGWAAESLSNVFLTPFFAVAAVLLTLDLIAAHDGAPLRPHSSPTPAPA
jgi:hypothetical protein